MVDESKQTQMESLATLLVLTEEIRTLATVREFGFFSTNETHRLVPYHTAYFWQLKEIIGTHIVAQSGSAEIDIHAPTNQWLIHKINEIRASASAKEIHQINLEEVLPESVPTEEIPENISPYLLWCPLLNKLNDVTGGLVFFRETTFSTSEIKMLGWLIASYQYTWLVIAKPQKLPTLAQLKKRPYVITICVVLLLVLFMPTRLSVLGDGTVVARKPILVNAPMQGVIKSFAVNPGDKVKVGQLLLTMDKTDFQAAVDVNKKNFLLTETKLRSTTNEGFTDKDARVEIPIIQAQLAIDKANLEYAEELLAKTQITSAINGIVIFESKDDWVGQPVRAGERILVVAEPKQVELKINLPIANSMKLSVGDKGEFYMYGSLSSLSVKIASLGYNAKLMPNKTLAYELHATFDALNPSELPQLGTQGTVKIYGHRVPLIYYLIRRPLQSLRQSLGI